MYLLGLLHWSLSHNHLPSNCYITFGQPSQSLPKSLFGKRSKFVLVSHRTTHSSVIQDNPQKSHVPPAAINKRFNPLKHLLLSNYRLTQYALKQGRGRALNHNHTHTHVRRTCHRFFFRAVITRDRNARPDSRDNVK